MKKIPTLFVRNKETHLVTDEVTPGCEWVFGDGVEATRKWDGTCCLLRDGKWFKRFELRSGKTAPQDFDVEEHDHNTGKTFGWLPVGDGPEDRWHREAIALQTLQWTEGTYELIGPKINGNPEGWSRHSLIRHGTIKVSLAGKPYRDVLIGFFGTNDIEGIVFYGPNGERAKIKAKDFGIRRWNIDPTPDRSGP